MIRKLIAALLVGAAVAYYAGPDEVATTARDMIDAAGRGARDVAIERCVNEPGDCLR